MTPMPLTDKKLFIYLFLSEVERVWGGTVSLMLFIGSSRAVNEQ